MDAGVPIAPVTTHLSAEAISAPASAAIHYVHVGHEFIDSLAPGGPRSKP
jgi:hypothetical protein